MDRAVLCLTLGGVSTLVVADLIEVVFSTKMFDRDRDLVYVREESIHSGGRGEFSLFDQFYGLLDWFAVWENHDWQLGLSEKSIFCFYRGRHRHGFDLAA